MKILLILILLVSGCAYPPYSISYQTAKIDEDGRVGNSITYTEHFQTKPEDWPF